MEVTTQVDPFAGMTRQSADQRRAEREQRRLARQDRHSGGLDRLTQKRGGLLSMSAPTTAPTAPIAPDATAPVADPSAKPTATVAAPTDASATTATVAPTATTSTTPAGVQVKPSATMPEAPAPVLSGEYSTEDRLNNLLSHDSEYMDLAATKAQQYANQRGLLNSSLAATAGHVAAIEAAAPIAQADADWANKNRMQADTLANERLIKQYEQQNLAFAQYLKGVADINMQDMTAEDKNAATARLFESYSNGSQVASTLANARIDNGEISWIGEDGTPTSGGGAPSSPADTGPMTITANTRAEMTPEERSAYEAVYGTTYEPSQVKTLVSGVTALESEYKGKYYSDAQLKSLFGHTPTYSELVAFANYANSSDANSGPVLTVTSDGKLWNVPVVGMPNWDAAVNYQKGLTAILNGSGIKAGDARTLLSVAPSTFTLA